MKTFVNLTKDEIKDLALVLSMHIDNYEGSHQDLAGRSNVTHPVYISQILNPGTAHKVPRAKLELLCAFFDVRLKDVFDPEQTKTIQDQLEQHGKIAKELRSKKRAKYSGKKASADSPASKDEPKKDETVAEREAEAEPDPQETASLAELRRSKEKQKQYYETLIGKLKEEHNSRRVKLERVILDHDQTIKELEHSMDAEDSEDLIAVKAERDRLANEVKSMVKLEPGDIIIEGKYTHNFTPEGLEKHDAQVIKAHAKTILPASPEEMVRHLENKGHIVIHSSKEGFIANLQEAADYVRAKGFIVMNKDDFNKASGRALLPREKHEQAVEFLGNTGYTVVASDEYNKLLDNINGLEHDLNKTAGELKDADQEIHMLRKSEHGFNTEIEHLKNNKGGSTIIININGDKS